MGRGAGNYNWDGGLQRCGDARAMDAKGFVARR